MTLQEAIKELKEYNSCQKKEKILSDRITEALDTLISAYEITDEDISYLLRMFILMPWHGSLVLKRVRKTFVTVK
jgi:hypothetical protein